MGKKLLCLCLILGLLVSCTITAVAKVFHDTEGHWSQEAIDKWSGYGIINGVGENEFNPDGYMTRAEAGAVFSRLLKLTNRADITSFGDIQKDAWYIESLEKCVSAGILYGSGNNINPDGYITREMFFVMFCRAMDIQPEYTLDKEYADAQQVSDWAQGYVCALINQGYVSGISETLIAPKNYIDRASVITLMDRIISNYVTQDNDILYNKRSGISLVVSNNCQVSDGFSGTIVLSCAGTQISLQGGSNIKVVVKADDISILNAPSGTTVFADKDAKRVKVNKQLIGANTVHTVKSVKTEEKKSASSSVSVPSGSSHTHSYDEVITQKATCVSEGIKTYTCRCGESYTKPIPKLSDNNSHTPAAAVKENEVAGTCQVEGTYDEVVYCSVCGEEISRTQKTSGYGKHTPAAAVKENIVAGSCESAGTYDEVVYCSTCRTELSRKQVSAEVVGHIPATPVKENEVAGTCQVEGTYDEVVYCSVCGEEISRTQKTSGYGEHTPAAAVKENEVAGTCQVEGTYDEVVYCSVCGKEISRTQRTSGYGEHTPAATVKENEVSGTCQVEGTYDEVVYCSVCDKEISRTQKTSGYGEHTPAAAVKENIVAGSCESAGTYDEVVYCSTCRTELSRKQVSAEVVGHVPATPVKENEVAGTCQVEGTYDEVIYCSVCGEEISRTQKTSGYGEHIPAAAVKENEVAGTCQVEGTYDEVVYCSVCGTEISRTQKTSGYGEHTPAAAVKENEVVGTCQVEGTYDEVVYCSVCGKEISRTQKTTEYGEHKYVSGNCEYCGKPETITQPTIKISDITANTGDTVDVIVSIINNPGISSLKIFVEYDEKLVLENVAFTSLFGSFITAPTPYVNPQAISMMSPMSDISSDGVFATLTFNIAALEHGSQADIKLTYDQGNTFDSNFENVIFNVIDGKIILSNTCNEHTPSYPVKENEIVGTCKIEGTYDEVVYCSACGVEISRTQKVTGLGGHNYKNGICTICGEATEITCPTIYVSSVKVNDDNETADVTIAIKNNPGISSLKVFVEYDEKLMLENVLFTSLFGSFITAPTPYTNPQAISMMSPMSDINSDGAFATLTFNISALETENIAEIKLTYDQGNTFNGNFDNVEFDVLNGVVKK